MEWSKSAVRRNGKMGLCCETERDGGTAVLDGLRRRNCGVRRNVTEVLLCQT
jgi:hypothetical protein